jgi:hypothetical protein
VQKLNRLSTEDFIKKAEKIHGDKYNYDLVEYVAYRTKVKILCNKCNNIFEQMPYIHLSGSGCTPCNFEIMKKKISISKDEFLFRSKNIHGDKYNYDYMNYVTCRTKVKILCNKCNNIFEQMPQSHLEGCGCKSCSIDKRRLTKEEFIIKAKNIHGNEYDYSLVGYINNVTKVKIICNGCENIFEQTPSSHMTGRGCPSCSIDKRRLTKEEFIIKAKNVHGNKYDYGLVEYVTNVTKVKILCNKCNNIFKQVPSAHTTGQGCPRCFESKGEIKVAKYLTETNISFIPQKTFRTLRDKRLLKLDFYLDDENLLIEYDGEYHYKAIRGSTPEIKQKNLEICQRRDKIKNEWAKANNIPLLRIPYWDFDRIEELIEAFILQHTKEKEIKQLVLEM